MSINMLLNNSGLSFDELNERKNAPVAAFYFYSKKNKKSVIPVKWTDKVKKVLKTASLSVQNSFSNFDTVKFAKSFVSSCSTSSILNNSATVLYYIVNNKPLNSKQKLDLFFHQYAPILNMQLSFMGYGSFEDMRLAIMAGSVNPAAFCQGFYNAFESIQNDSRMKLLEARYDEMLPIDVVMNISFDYNNPSKVHRVHVGEDNKIYSSQLNKVIINLHAKIQNVTGDYLYSGTYVQKLIDCMMYSNPVMLRIGKNIYKDCKIEELTPKIDENVYSISLYMTLSYILSNKYKGTFSGISGLNVLN